MNDPFLDACGATGPLLLSTESPGTPGGETRAFDLPFVLAGRDPRSDLRLGHPDVSDRHAYFQLVAGQLLCIDLGSRIGIFQGGKCQRLGYVERDRAVRIGPYRVRLVGGDRTAGAAPDAAGPPRRPLSLELSHRSVRNSRCELPEGLALVGSAADCQIRLVDPSVSNYHCSLVHAHGGVWVVDLLGQGGVRVNGQEVAYAPLHEGDSLRIGHSTVRLSERNLASFPDEIVRPDARRVLDPPRGLPASAELASLGPGDESQAVEMVERVVGPIVGQIGLLQQQIADEFHQARAMLFETFSTLQREQMAFVNQELEQIRQLSQELHALRASLERQANPPNGRVAPPQIALRLGAATNPGPPLDAQPAPLCAAEGRSPGPAAPGPVAPPDAAARVAFEDASQRHGSQPASIEGLNEQAHAKLCVRIARLQKKHVSGWGKLLAIFPGADTGDSPV